MTKQPLFHNIAFIGIGLIGSSLAHVVRRDGLAATITVTARTQKTLDTALRLKLADRVTLDAADAAKDADLVVICTPMGTYKAIAETIGASLKPGAIVTDVGSCKASVIADLAPHLPAGVHLVPGHPVAGTEHSGPEAGFAELFQNRWCILTPAPGTDEQAILRVETLWRS
ncbi:MAG: prephenate dehydrogenase/arogenate dehydrogenase family protein, partial [Proteobacteria bacterium]|nr:prephenate dehydrogenase/arogenate dehydrogenase family protein [Pseudomonadota bacterium]